MESLVSTLLPISNYELQHCSIFHTKKQSNHTIDKLIPTLHYSRSSSPCGVTVIKSSSGYTIKGFTPDQFPSPYGVTVIKSNRVEVIQVFEEFPSPYGVTVIKSYEGGKSYTPSGKVSVPLRGNGN